MKKMYIAWGLIVGGITLSLLFIGLNIKQETKVYKALENDMKEAANAYIKTTSVDLNVGESIKYDDNFLLKSGLLKSMDAGKEKCTGYVKVKRNTANYEYKPYIKCEKYTTDGYVG